MWVKLPRQSRSTPADDSTFALAANEPLLGCSMAPGSTTSRTDRADHASTRLANTPWAMRWLAASASYSVGVVGGG